MNNTYVYDDDGAKALLKHEMIVNAIITAIIIPIAIVVFSYKEISEGKSFTILNGIVLSAVIIVGMVLYLFRDLAITKKMYKGYKIEVKDFEIIYDCISKIDRIDNQVTHRETMVIRSIKKVEKNRREITIYGDIETTRYLFGKKRKEKTIKEVTIPKFFGKFDEFVELVESRKTLV